MRTNHTSAFVLIVAVLFIFSCAQMTDYTDQIEAANQKFMEYFSNGDATGLANCYTEDGQLLPTNSEIITGLLPIQEFWQGAMDMGVKRAILETVEVEGMGLYAYELGKYELYAVEDLMIDHGKYIVIWKKAIDSNEWKMYRDIWNTSMPLPE